MKTRLPNRRLNIAFFKKIFILVFFLSLTANFCFAESAETPEHSTYRIGPGDVIEVSVWTHPELTKELNVRPDGWINYPLAGEVLASGSSPDSLALAIRKQLRRFIKDPRVSVNVTKMNSKKILVLGEVKRPGLYVYQAGITAFEAIGLADGYNKHAQLKSILVVRNPYTKQPEFYLANLYRVIHDYDTRQNIILQAGDIVYVPQNFIGNVGDFLDYFLSRIQPAATTYFMYEVGKQQGK